MLLAPEVQRFVIEQRLGFVATVRADGTPNLSPKGTTTVLDDRHLLFADIASPQTVENLAGNPHVEINVVDPIVRKGYRFRGTGEVHRAGSEFQRGLRALRDHGSTTPQERIRSIVVVEVTEVSAIFSPAYDAGATEDELAGRWLSHFASLHGRHS